MPHRRPLHHPIVRTTLALAWLAFACVPGTILAADQQPAPPGSSLRFRHLRIEDGLAQSSVQAIVQDAEGYMWLGTQDGLQRYDGYEFLTLRHDPADAGSLADNSVNALILTRDGALWAGTSVRGLDRLDPGTRHFTHFQHDANDAASLASNQVFTLYVDREQRLWVGTGAGLELFSGSGFKHYPVPASSTEGGQVYSLHEDGAGRLWVGSGHGIYYLDGDHLKPFIAQGRMTADQRGLFTESPIHAIAEVQGLLWIASGRGIAELDKQYALRHYYTHSDAPDSMSSEHALALLPDQEGGAWVGTYAGGLNHFESGEERFSSYQHDATDPGSLGSNDISVLYQDRSGLIWIGTDSAGVDIYNPRTRAFGYYRHKQGDANSLGSNMVWSVYKDGEGQIWAGTDQGLTRLDASRHRYRQYHMGQRPPTQVDDDQISDVTADHAGVIWTATDYGMFRYLPGKDSFQRFTLVGPHEDSNGDVVSFIYPDSQGRLWAGTGDGLVQVDAAHGKLRRFRHDPARADSLPGPNVSAICETEDKRLWLGTSNGLASFDGVHDSFKVYHTDPRDPTSLSYDNVQSCRVDVHDGLWVGTADGLNYLAPGEQKFRRYFQSDGLPNDTIYAILTDLQGGVWMSTDDGLSRLDPGSGTFHNYVESDGLQSDEFNGGSAYAAPDGELLFGGVNGLNAFYPERISRDDIPPDVAITRFLRQNTEVPLATPEGPLEEVQVQYRENVLSFDFTAFDYAEPQLNTFSYRLEGFDSDWRTLRGSHTATYTNLDPGKYVLHVRGANSDGVWNVHETTLGVEVLPPAYRTGWAWLLYVTAAFVALMVGMGLYKRILEREHRLDDEQRRRRWAEALHDLIHRVSSQRDERAIAEHLIDTLTNFIEYEQAMFYAERDGTLHLLASRGITAGEQAFLEHWPQQQPQLVARLRQSSKAQQLGPEDAATLSGGGRPGRHHYLAVPIQSAGRGFRLLVVARPNRSLDGQEVEVAAAMAKQVSMALDNAQLIQDLEDLATTDGLTRLYNRRHFMDRAESEFLRSQRYRRELSVFLIDADHFKAINDTHGHDAGDRCLRALAIACRQGLRQLDVIGRYGGEEVVVLLPETSAAVAYETAERLRRDVEQLRIPGVSGDIRFTVSIGVATAGPHTESVAALINEADRALYEAKRGGRNRVVSAAGGGKP